MRSNQIRNHRITYRLRQLVCWLFGHRYEQDGFVEWCPRCTDSHWLPGAVQWPEPNADDILLILGQCYNEARDYALEEANRRHDWRGWTHD